MESGPTQGTPTQGSPARRSTPSSRTSKHSGQRASNACHACRDKKVKCSGNLPCVYCLRRGLDCVFTKTPKRRLYSISHVRDLELKVAGYENRGETGPDRRGSEPPPPSATESRPSPTDSTSASGVARPEAHAQPAPAGQGVPETTPTRALALETSLSSSDVFSSELRTLLSERSGPNWTSPSAGNPATAPPLPSNPIRQPDMETIRDWPTEEDAQSMLEIVYMNVAVSQHLFDARSFSDNLTAVYDAEDDDNGGTLSSFEVAKCLLIFAVGRLLQARWDDTSTLPGEKFFNRATKQLPDFAGLLEQRVLGIELMALCALYLQIADRKDEAYLYASMALRLALALGLHKSRPNRNVPRSQTVHCNRLFWSVYMQERRLAAAKGFPMAIADTDITANYPADHIGHPSAAAIVVNVKLGEITGRITSTVYSHDNSKAEAAFTKELQDILQSLHKIETTMPTEIAGGVHPSELLLREQPLSTSQRSSTRTIASLYLTVYQNVIYGMRPVLLYLVRSSSSDSGDHHSTMSPGLRRLADACVEAARKSLIILQGLRNRDMIAKHAFIDLDCIFSAAFVFVLAAAINPGQSQALEGIDSARSILMYLANLGNRAAAKRLSEIDQMCAHLTVETETPDLSAGQLQILLRPFSFEEAASHQTTAGFDGVPSEQQQALPQQCSTPQTVSGGAHPREDPHHHQNHQDVVMMGGAGAPAGGATDLSGIDLAGEESVYWMYHNPALSLTGVELLDWEMLETQTTALRE